jgi:hypothetical protein
MWYEPRHSWPSMALGAHRPPHPHLSEEELENYALGRLPEAQLPEFEEHLLLCERCQQRLDFEDDLAAAMRPVAGIEDGAPLDALSTPPASPVHREWRRRLFPLRDQMTGRKWLAPALGAAFLLAFGVVIPAWKPPLVQTDALKAETVTLTTVRGGEGQGMAQAQANRPLDLSIQLQVEMPADVSAAGGPLARTDSYRLDMVDAAGGLRWTGTVRPALGKLAARVGKRMGAGVYWVRLYAPSGKLLREFGLRLE